VVFCFDADAAGQRAAERSLDVLVQNFGVHGPRRRGPAERSLDSLLQNDLIVRVAEMPAGEDPDSLVRREGKEEFEKRVAAARDFFDYWIDHEIAAVDLHSLGAKVQVARRLAEIISRVHDPLLRGEAINKASARLAVPAVDFETLLPKQSRWAEIRRDSPPAEPSSPGPGPE